MIIKFYIVATLLTIFDEAWNIKNPRPYPKQIYYSVQWEEKDFYTFKIDDEWVLRKYRKTDNNIKREVRKQYWEKRNGRSKR
tara:strand:+ start:783 stop:1028 length:246 start_codon:yes stop_codon:yes gene_type:complete